MSIVNDIHAVALDFEANTGLQPLAIAVDSLLIGDLVDEVRWVVPRDSRKEEAQKGYDTESGNYVLSMHLYCGLVPIIPCGAAPGYIGVVSFDNQQGYKRA